MTKRSNPAQADMFAATCEDLPLFSGVAARVQEEAYTPQQVNRQEVIPGFERDWVQTAKVINQKKGKGK